MAGSTMRFQKYRFTKAKGLRFMMNGTQKQLKTPAIRKKRVMIRAKFAGSGKNFIGKHFNDLSYNTFFVVPQNMQKQDVPCDAVTQNRLFSVPVCKGESRLPKYDYNEIYMSSPYILKKIRVFCNENPHLIVIGAGDVKQLPRIEPFTNNPNGEEYVDNCMDIIFKYNIFLQIRKRVGGKDTEEEQE
jgi:hypothetical protein